MAFGEPEPLHSVTAAKTWVGSIRLLQLGLALADLVAGGHLRLGPREEVAATLGLVNDLRQGGGGPALLGAMDIRHVIEEDRARREQRRHRPLAGSRQAQHQKPCCSECQNRHQREDKSFPHKYKN